MSPEQGRRAVQDSADCAAHALRPPLPYAKKMPLLRRSKRVIWCSTELPDGASDAAESFYSAVPGDAAGEANGSTRMSLPRGATREHAAALFT
jgi:hypothetical protein